MTFFFTVLIAPFIVALGAFVLDKAFGWKQLCAQFAVQLVIAGAAAGITSCANVHDTEVWGRAGG